MANMRRMFAAQAIDAAMWIVAIPAWFVLRYDGFGGFRADNAWLYLIVAIIVTVLVSSSVSFFLIRRNGRPLAGSFEDMWRLVWCNTAAGVVLLVVNEIASPRLVPNSVVVGATATATLGSMAVRGSVRRHRERAARNSPSSSSPSQRAIIFGAGDGGIQLVASLLRDGSSPYIPVAVLDDNPNRRNLSIRGVRVVGGRRSIGSVAKQFRASVLIIAVPSASSTLVREIAALANDADLRVLVLPSISEIFDGTVGVGDIRPVSLLDLLGRETVEIDLTSAGELLCGRRVLVTGAGGSIGSEIARQVNRLGPAELVLLDRDESVLHALQLELEGRALLVSRNLVVADIRDRDRMFEVFEEHRPDVVFHAAALKHLPLLEMHPAEAFKTNVKGSRNVLDAAAAHEVGHVVNISTDKAADPTSALGASKRMAEGLTAATAARGNGVFLSVRFGNVLGSRGTVLDAFRAQIDAGGPLTVTDPEVTRFFMTVSEAVQLVLHAATIGASGEVLVLDMGDPVKIVDVARQMAAQSPRPIEIVFTGLRPGEKLHEDLFSRDEIARTGSHPMISHVDVPPLSEDHLAEVDGIEDCLVTETMLLVVRREMAGGSRAMDARP
jgi:FlaA1/EpsC-like NDP-sugar epimerase